MGNNWLPVEASSARKERRHLERRYARTPTASNKSAYRQWCRRSNKLINDSRSAFLCNEVTQSVSDPRLLWKTVRQLLHHGSGTAHHGLDTASFATNLSNYFADKVKLVKAKVDAGLQAAVNTGHGAGPPLAVSSAFQLFNPVTPLEVRRLLLAAPAKTSPLDSLQLLSSRPAALTSLLYWRTWQTCLFHLDGFQLPGRMDWFHRC